jgi:hypothetical protein
MPGKVLYNPRLLNIRFREGFYRLGWEKPGQTPFYPTDDADLTKELLQLDPNAQKEKLRELGKKTIRSYNEADLLKDRVALEVQFVIMPPFHRTGERFRFGPCGTRGASAT